ncbi:MAG: hypothetical protein AB7O64_17820 [Methylibium sp.]
MPAPARVVGHSPFARYSHSPRPPLPVRPVTVGVLVGLLLTAFWREVLTLAAFGTPDEVRRRRVAALS